MSSSRNSFLSRERKETVLTFLLFFAALFPAVQADDLHAEKILAWEFQRSEDRNIDQWPDGWRRRAGREFPAYIPIRIVPRDPQAAQVAREAEPQLSKLWMKYQSGRYFKDFIPESTPEPIGNFVDKFLVNSCLSIDMDGAAVQLESPAFKLDSRFTYALDASIATRGLDGHQVWLELLLLDEAGREVDMAKTAQSSGTTDWHHITTGSLSSEALTMGQVVIHIDPLKARRLTGNVRIDEIRLYRMPKLELSVDVPFHVAAPNQPINVTCLVLGVSDARSSVNFKLVDHTGELCDQTVASLNPTADAQPPVIKEPQLSKPPSSTSDQPPSGKLVRTKSQASKQPETREQTGQPLQSPANSQRMDGIAKWPIKVAQPGYYRIIVDLGRTMQNGQLRTISRETSLAVVNGSRAGVGGPFGWSLPDFDKTITPETVPELVRLGGVGWLKIPVWFDARDVQTADRLSVLLERLDIRKVNCVGILERPLDRNASRIVKQPAAATFSTPADWEPELEPALTRMSMKLNWFQLGRDFDRSFIGNPNLVPLVTDIRNRMQNYSQELQLALAWDYQDPVPNEKNLPWRASQMSSEPQLTAAELRSHLSQKLPTEHTRWITLNPLPASRYRTLDRARDLTERMIVIKEYKAEAAFLTTPLDRESGIFNPDGSAGELFLPWRVLNQHLASATYLGSFTMPGGSHNVVFGEGQTGFMIVWNDRKAIEQLYLGEEVKAIDLWGRPLPVEQAVSNRQTPEQKILVTSWPILLQGIDVAVAQWRMRFQLENKRLPSTLGLRTELPLSIDNTLGSSVYGTVSLHAPTLLQPTPVPANTRFQMGEGSNQRVLLPIPVLTGASAGKHALRFDFQASADRDVTFSAYDSLVLGIGDVELTWETIDINEERAILRVEVVNSNSRPVSFDCKLFPPQKPYQFFQIANAPTGTTQREVTLPLNGVREGSKLQIECSEIDSNRKLNYEIPLSVGE